jgi:nitroreductase
MDQMMTMIELERFESIVRGRKTTKLMAQENFPGDRSLPILDNLLACAGWAPFHRMCSTQHRVDTGQPTGIEPWRFHVLEAADCRQLREFVLPLPAAGKIPAMLATCDALIMATWLPNPPQADEMSDDTESFEPSLENVEHIAAASAAVQSLLLASTAAEIDNYWSSGGVLRTAEVFQLLGIPTHQRLLGAIFLFPRPTESDIQSQTVGSKLRDSRGDLNAWSRRVQLASPEVIQRHS